MHILITGAGGFVGEWLYIELSKHGHCVHGVGRKIHPGYSSGGSCGFYQSLDLSKTAPDTKSVDSIVHLAGLAAVGPSFNSPQEYINTNSSIVTNLCEKLLAEEFKGRLIIVSSGAIYSSHQTMPIKEKGRIEMSSPYVVSKVLCENQAEYYRGRGLDIVVARPFNHIGPGQSTGFLVPDLIKKIRDSSAQNPNILVGNIHTRRDYTDVRDIVRAYRVLIEAPSLKHQVYNICSSKSLSGFEIIDIICEKMEIKRVATLVDPKLIRSSDASEIMGDRSRITNEIGWVPEINISTTISDYLS